jgi:HJR/Mrr/RecB family endonuclease
MRIAAYCAGVTDEYSKAISDATRTTAQELTRNLQLVRQPEARPDCLVVVYGAHVSEQEKPLLLFTQNTVSDTPMFVYLERSVMNVPALGAFDVSVAPTGELHIPLSGLPTMSKDTLVVAFVACQAIAASKRFSLFSDPRELAETVRRDMTAMTGGALRDRNSRWVVLASIVPLDIKTILANPRELQTCNPRRFEELVAELLASDGWEDVRLVPRSNAAGPDIIAVSSRFVRGVPLKMIVECKRHTDGRPVDVDVVRKVMYWVNEEYRATMGMIATTSRFTSAATELARNSHFWRLTLRDQEAIIDWLRKSPLGKR